LNAAIVTSVIAPTSSCVSFLITIFGFMVSSSSFLQANDKGQRTGPAQRPEGELSRDLHIHCDRIAARNSRVQRRASTAAGQPPPKWNTMGVLPFSARAWLGNNPVSLSRWRLASRDFSRISAAIEVASIDVDVG
jgi:hypothetical protein